MKKIIFNTFALAAIIGMFFISCEKDESEKHEYTPEELEEIRRQDSLKNIIPADYVFTQDVVLPYSDNWETVTVKLVEDKDTMKLLELFEYSSIAELVEALGTLEGDPPNQVQTGNDITFYAYNWSTKYVVDDPSTTNSFGHWFTANGDVTTWGNDQILYCEKTEGTTLEFNIGHLPEGPAVGDEFHIVEAMKYDTTEVAFVFNVTIADEIPLVYPVTTVVGSETVDIEAEQNNDYIPTLAAIDAAAITTAIGIAPGDAELYGVNASSDSLYIDGFTANNGFWFNTSGDVCSWGNEGCVMAAEYDAAAEAFNLYQFPDGSVAGETYTVTLAFVNLTSLQEYDIVINLTVTEAAAVYPETTLEGTQNLSASADTVRDYSATAVTVDTAAILTAIGVGPASATLYGVNATTDSLYIDGLTANNGCWFNTDGDVCKWGDAGAAIAAEYDVSTGTINMFQHGNPGATQRGQTYTAKLAFVNDSKRYVVVVQFTMN
ncbi:MAG: DUF4859 domain-containing protein [Bacteroidales bacterium]|nr:DUF4859 domain-containing protein [Bacteroidales bacterium]